MTDLINSEITKFPVYADIKCYSSNFTEGLKKGTACQIANLLSNLF